MPTKEYHRDKSRSHYEQNRESYRKRDKKKHKEHREFVDDIKRTSGCKLCPEKEPVALDFHHVGSDKDYSIAKMRGWSPERKLQEMKKCVIVCSNCHRKIHAGLIDSPLPG